jgi:hypothetical protein
MLRSELLKEIAELPSPILSVYLNVRSDNPSRHPSADTGEVWLTKQIAAMSKGLSRHSSKQIAKELRRVQNFLHDRHPNEKALAIFAGPLSWAIAPLQVAVENAVAWGQPAIAQLFWLLHEHHSYGIVAIDHHAARFFAYRLGQLTELATKEFAVDSSAWKEKALGHLTGGRMQNMRGPYTDRFEHRVEEQYARLCRETAEETASLSKQHGFVHVFIVGPDRMINVVQEHFALAFKECVSEVREDLGTFSSTMLLERFEPIITEYERTREMAAVDRLLGSDRSDVADVDETLAELQAAGVRSIVVSKNLEFDLRRCVKCGLSSRAADPVCATCGGERPQVSFHEMLPVLAMSHDADVEVVSGEAARRLDQIGGMIGWLRSAQTTMAR